MTLPKSSGWPYSRPPFNSFEDMSIKIYSIWVPVQDNSSALYKSSLSSQEIVTCSVKYCGELPGPHSLSLPSWPTCTWHKIIESDSTLWCCIGGRKGLLWNTSFMGCKECTYTNIVTPTTQSHVPSIFWFSDHGSCTLLVLLQDFAITRAWYYVLRNTTKPAYHSKNPWLHIVLSWPNAYL